MINEGVRKNRSMNSSRRKVWRYAHANFDLASTMLSNCDLNTILEPNDINISWDCWKKFFLDVMERCIPTAFLPNRRNLPWLSKSLIQLMKKRNRRFQKARASNDPEVWNRYRNLRNKLVTKLREAKFIYFSQLNPQNCKEFWKAVKYTNKKETCIPTLNDDNSPAVAHLSSEKAPDMLNSFFARCFNHALPTVAEKGHSKLPISRFPFLNLLFPKSHF